MSSLDQTEWTFLTLLYMLSNYLQSELCTLSTVCENVQPCTPFNPILIGGIHPRAQCLAPWWFPEAPKYSTALVTLQSTSLLSNGNTLPIHCTSTASTGASLCPPKQLASHLGCHPLPSPSPSPQADWSFKKKSGSEHLTFPLPGFTPCLPSGLVPQYPVRSPCWSPVLLSLSFPAIF